MSDKLQAAVRWVAEGAGYEIVNGDQWLNKIEHGLEWPFDLPGNDGTLEGEVELVLGWLARAGYSVTLFQFEWGIRQADGWEKISQRVEIEHYRVPTGQPKRKTVDKLADTLHAALASALVALHEGASASPITEPVCDLANDRDNRRAGIRCIHNPRTERCGAHGGWFQHIESEPPDAA